MASLSESNVALQTERRRHQSTLRRLDRVRAELDGLRTAGARREEELELLREGFAELRAENAALRARIALTARPLNPKDSIALIGAEPQSETDTRTELHACG